MAITETHIWTPEETVGHLSMYDNNTRYPESVTFHPDRTIGTFTLRPIHFADRFSPLVANRVGELVIDETSDPHSGNLLVLLNPGHFTGKYGISVMRGIDQLEAAIQVQKANVGLEPGQAVRVIRTGAVKFAQPAVPDDNLMIIPQELTRDWLNGNSIVTADGSTTTKVDGIELQIVQNNIRYAMSTRLREYVKTIFIEAGAQVGVSDFLYRRQFQTPEEQATGDFLVFKNIDSVEWYGDVYPFQRVEIHLVKNQENPLKGDIDFYVDNRQVAKAFGSECGIGNREKTALLINKVVARRRGRVLPNG